MNNFIKFIYVNGELDRTYINLYIKIIVLLNNIMIWTVFVLIAIPYFLTNTNLKEVLHNL